MESRDEVTLVPASSKDVPMLASFLAELFLLEDDFTPDYEHQVAALDLIMDNPQHAEVHLIEVGEEVAGMAALHLSISTAEGGWSGRIEDVYLKPEFRRQGVGRQAIEQLVAIAKEKGLKRLVLGADKGNDSALRFYAACGFAPMNLVLLMRHI